MSIRSSSTTRNIEARKSTIPTIGRGKPLNSQGNEGDLTFRRTSGALMLYIKANHSWHGVKVGESFSSLEKVINNVKSKVDTIKQFRLPSTYSVTGDFTLDVSGDITLDADGGQVNIKDGGTNHFVFDCDNTKIDIFDDANASDYFRLAVNTNGATTLTTVDSDAALAHFTIDADGDVILDSATTSGYTKFAASGTTFARFEAHHSNSYLTLFENAGASDDDYFQIACAANGATAISTVDANASVAHITIRPDGDLILDPLSSIKIEKNIRLKEEASAGPIVSDYGQIWVKNSTPSELCFTDGADTDIVGIGKYQYETKFVGYYGNNAYAWLPMNGYIVEGSTNTGRNEYQAFIAPFNGELVSYHWRSEIAQGGSSHSLRVNEASDGTEIPGTLIYRKDYDPGSIADDTTTLWDFSSPSVGSATISFTKGRLYQFYVAFAAAPLDTNITLTFKWDITS